MLSTGQGPEQTEPIGSRLHPLLASLSLQAYTLHYSSSECLDDEYFIHLQTLSPLGSWNNVIPQPRSRGQSLSCPWTPPLPNLCLSTPSLLSSQAFWLWQHCGQWCRPDLGAYLPQVWLPLVPGSGCLGRLSWVLYHFLSAQGLPMPHWALSLVLNEGVREQNQPGRVC